MWSGRPRIPGPAWGAEVSARVNVLFLEIDLERSWSVASIGPACLAAWLRRHGYGAGLLRVGVETQAGDVAAAIRASGAGLVGVSLTTRQWLPARRLLAALRQHVAVPVVAGGLHPTYSPEETLAAPGIDFVCLGEGEAVLLDLVQAIEAGGPIADGSIANLWVKGGTRPPLRPPIEPLDALPPMARDLLDERHGVVHMTTQRGCPFPCTYCAARLYEEMYAGLGRYGRRRSVGSVIGELEAIRAAGPLNYVIFLDDTFTLHRPWVMEFCRIYRERIGVGFSLHARVETMVPAMIEALAAAGCFHITYGVESGSERVRREVMQRPVGNDRLVDVFRATREAGILVTANYMIGVPGETRDDLDATLALHDELRPDDFGYFVFYPYPGTRLFQHCRDRGYLPADYLDRPASHRETILDLPDLSADDIRAAYDRWTQVRTAAMLARLGPDCPEDVRRSSIAAVEASAALG